MPLVTWMKEAKMRLDRHTAFILQGTRPVRAVLAGWEHGLERRSIEPIRVV